MCPEGMPVARGAPWAYRPRLFTRLAFVQSSFSRMIFFNRIGLEPVSLIIRITSWSLRYSITQSFFVETSQTPETLRNLSRSARNASTDVSKSGSPPNWQWTKLSFRLINDKISFENLLVLISLYFIWALSLASESWTSIWKSSCTPWYPSFLRISTFK